MSGKPDEERGRPMTNKWARVVVRSALLLGAAVVLFSPARAQTSPNAAKAKTSPAGVVQTSRTPQGQSDLEGVWSIAFLTPLQRDPQLGNKQFFTPEEAAAYLKKRSQELDADRRDLPPDADTALAYNQAWYDRGTKLGRNMRTSLVIDPPDGRIPPMTPEAKRRFENTHAYSAAHPADGPEDRTLGERCLNFSQEGPPLLPGGYNNNYQIVQTRNYVAILAEMGNKARIIPLDGRPHLPQSVSQWNGDSRGHWEGKTLVVDTTNVRFNDKSHFGVNYDGLTDQNLRVTERFTRTAADTITYQATVNDPTVYTKPWTMEIVMSKTEDPLFEYACHEGNYGMFGILGGARADEKKAAEQGGHQ
ncbi:MAG: hypothetical protein DMG31_02740 [Acidobacteria bacterium]|nr:MAG: hypothetical protein DMG31_02740 [Acidobacteriota bacterium]